MSWVGAAFEWAAGPPAFAAAICLCLLQSAALWRAGQRGPALAFICYAGANVSFLYSLLHGGRS